MASADARERRLGAGICDGRGGEVEPSRGVRLSDGPRTFPGSRSIRRLTLASPAVSRARKRRRSSRGGSHGRATRGLPELPDPLEDVFESGGELFLAVGYTPGGAPFGPRVEVADGELVFPDEPRLDVDSDVGPEDEDSPHWDPPPLHRDSPF